MQSLTEASFLYAVCHESVTMEQQIFDRVSGVLAKPIRAVLTELG